MVSRCENKMRPFVMLACLMTSFAAGCSETPSASLPPTNSAADGSKIESDPVDSGDENGPAISKPLEEPPVESAEGQSSEKSDKG
jgi:hypothetical protein